jgi:hypothetical protein
VHCETSLNRGRAVRDERSPKGSAAVVSGKRIYLLGEIGDSNDLDREVQSFTFQVH